MKTMKRTKKVSRVFTAAVAIALVLQLVGMSAMTALASETTPARNAGTGTNVNGPGTIAWTNPGNISTDDTNYATANLGNSATSDYLQGTNYGFAIPSDATINGIQVSIMRQSSANTANYSINDADLNLLKAGAIVGTDKAVSTDWPTTMGVANYGATNDLWGATWTPAEINASNFGVSLSVQNQSFTSNRTASVDYIQIAVTYTAAVGDTTAPVISQVTPVATPTNDTTPSYAFATDEAGVITVGGSCSIPPVTNAAVGNNTITLNSLAEGTYANCTVKVTDAAGNQSNVLAIPSFTIDTNIFDTGMVTLSYDDGYDTIYDNARPILDAKNMKSTQYIYTEALHGASLPEDDPLHWDGFMNQTELMNMSAAGHDVASHSRTHPTLVGATESALKNEIDGARLDLLSLGIKPVNSFAYPFGENDASVQSAVKAAGFSGARGVQDGFNDKSTSRYDLKVFQVNGDTTLADVVSKIDEARNTKTWLVLLFHEVRATCATVPSDIYEDHYYCVTTANMQAIADYLASSGTAVKTMSEGLALMSNHPVSDGIAPVITQADLIVPATSPAGAVVTYAPAVSDNDANLPAALGAYCQTPTGLVSGSTFPIGTMTVTCTASDAGGNMGTKLFTVTVTDATAPTVVLATTSLSPTKDSPIPVTATFSESVTEFIVSDIASTNATVADFSGSGATYVFNVIPAADGLVTVNIPAGVAQDAALNLNTAATELSITSDRTAPVVSITQPDSSPAKSKTITASSTDGTLSMNLGAGSVCDATLTFAAYSPTTFSSEADNGKTVCYKAEDSALNVSYSLSAAISGIDTTAPIITLSGDNPQTIELGAGYTELGAATNDGSPVTIDKSNFQDAVGSYTIAYNATDAAGNKAAQVTRTVNVVDTGAPVITIAPYNTAPTNQNITVSASTNEGTLNATEHLFTANGSFDFVATDSANNTTTKTVTITNIDKVAPIITLSGNNPQTIELGAGYTELGAATNDGSPVTIDKSNFQDTVGSYTIAYNATDAAGNKAAQVTRTVNVVEKPVPASSLKNEINVTSNTPSLGFNAGKKAKKKVTFTFKGLTLTKKKWVKIRINGRKVKVLNVRRSGGDSLVTVSLNYRNWATGKYGLSMSYKNQTKVPYKTSKGRTKYRKAFESGTVNKEDILEII